MSLMDHFTGPSRPPGRHTPEAVRARIADAEVPPTPARPEADQTPAAVAALETMRGLLVRATDPRAGAPEATALEDIARIAAQIKAQEIAGEPAVEILGALHVLDEQASTHENQRTGAQYSASSRADGAPRPVFSPERANIYQRALAELKTTIYKGQNADDVIPDVVKGDIGSEPTTVSWTGFPVTIESYRGPEVRDKQGVALPDQQISLVMGPDYVLSARSGEDDFEVPEQGMVIDHFQVRSAAPYGIEITDTQTGAEPPSAYFRTQRYPDPDELNRSHMVDQARSAIEQQGAPAVPEAPPDTEAH